MSGLSAATSLLHEIYVVTENSDKVYVYFCHRPYELKAQVRIPNMDPADIATSYADVCVYVLDSGNECIWRIDRKQKTREYPLNVGPGKDLKSMSITQKGVIVVVLSGNKIAMYNPVNQETKLVSLKAGEGIAHAAEIGDNRLLACHDTQTFVYDLKRAEVCEAMDVGGNHISMKSSNCAIVTDKAGQGLRMLDVEKWKTEDMTDERNGRGNLTYMYVRYAMENGLLLASWKKYLYVYSFDKVDAESHLAGSDSEARQKHEPEAASSENATGTTFFEHTLS